MKNFNHLLSTIFLLSLGILAFISIFSSSIFGFDITQVPFLSPLYSHLSSAQYALVILAIAMGSLLFYSNRDKIESIEEEQTQELLEEEERKKEFEKNFPILNKIPLLGWILKWMYKEGWKYSLIFYTKYIF